MVLASIDKVVLGSIGFVVFWVLAVFPSVRFLPIGRTAGSLLSAVLMIVFRVISPEQGYDAIDLSVLGLLFGTMVVGLYLERADMFNHLGKLLSWKCCGPKDLLCRICVVSALSSALFTNDTTCIVLTEFVLRLAKENNIAPHPFLLALSSSANIGSAATPIGNPQNLVIAIQSKISFGQFLLGLFPSTAVGVVVNMLFLLIMYWTTLRVENVVENLGDEESNNVATNEATEGEKEDAVIDGTVSLQRSVERNEDPISAKWKRVSSKIFAYLVTTGMLIALVMGLNMSWTVITASLILIVLDFKDAGPCLEKVSYSILLLFCGMFIAVEGFNETGIPSALWNVTKPHAQINNVSGLVVLSLVILVLSNVASNVPTVLLLGGRVAAQAAIISPSEVKKAWLILGWVSTVAGNLSLPGSAANLIVCEQARRAQSGKYTLSFWTHLKFGLPSTLVVTAIGLALIRG